MFLKNVSILRKKHPKNEILRHNSKGGTCNRVSPFLFEGVITIERYIYEGPVEVFGKCVDNRWRGETMADSEARARCNLAYQYKKQTGRTAATRITLPGKIKKGLV